MNDIQKKSLAFTVGMAVLYVLIALVPALFAYLFLFSLVYIVAFSAYYFSFVPTRAQFVEKSKFLIIPFLFNGGAILFLSYVSLQGLRVVIGLTVAIANYYLYVALKRVLNLEDRAAIFQRNLLISYAFVTVLLSLSSIFRFYVLFSTSKQFTMPVSLVVLLVAMVFYFLLYFLAWENGLDMKKIFPYTLVSSLLASEIALVGIIWVVNYPVFSGAEKANLGGFPLPAIFLTIIFYFIWGIISHKMDRSLTRRVMTEYVIISVLFLAVLLATAKWLPII